jgi:hypothetical protein
LAKWQGEEHLHRAREIRTHASSENRFLTPREEQQARSCDRAGFHAIVHSMLVDSIQRMKKDSERRLAVPTGDQSAAAYKGRGRSPLGKKDSPEQSVN